MVPGLTRSLDHHRGVLVGLFLRVIFICAMDIVSLISAFLLPEAVSSRLYQICALPR